MMVRICRSFYFNKIRTAACQSSEHTERENDLCPYHDYLFFAENVNIQLRLLVIISNIIIICAFSYHILIE